ncbi:MAG TPA: hypothetical protein VE915_08230 [Actinomycetota bacterium]|nr:hypothetical protein [Actinomycetota bacterium]
MSLAQKLQIKERQSVSVLHAPRGLEIELPEGTRRTSNAAASDVVVVFATNRAELAKRADPFVKAARRDALAWIAYPKAGQLNTDLNRDSLGELLQERGIRPVRQVAIDDIWSALRFRPA